MNLGSDLDSFYQMAKVEFGPAQFISLNEAAAIPYASIGVRLGDSNQILLVLATNEGGQQLWTSGARVSILMHDGRIVRTGGLGHNLGSLQALHIASQGGTTHVRWTADFPELSLYSVPISCVQTLRDDEVISILGKDIRTRRIEERCQAKSDQLDWGFTDTFWRDSDNSFVWKSVQHVNPKLAPLEIEILRPPAKE